MKMRSWMSLAAGCAVLVWAGCSTPEGPYVAVAKPNSPEAAGKPVVLLNNSLLKKLAVDRPPVAQRDANNLMQIQVGLRNRTDNERLRIQVQTMFFDEGGHVLYSEPGSEAAWQSLVLSPNETVFYVQKSLTPEAVRYTVRVRYVKKTH